jgi:hypothetical protein
MSIVANDWPTLRFVSKFADCPILAVFPLQRRARKRKRGFRILFVVPSRLDFECETWPWSASWSGLWAFGSSPTGSGSVRDLALAIGWCAQARDRTCRHCGGFLPCAVQNSCFANDFGVHVVGLPPPKGLRLAGAAKKIVTEFWFSLCHRKYYWINCDGRFNGATLRHRFCRRYC